MPDQNIEIVTSGSIEALSEAAERVSDRVGADGVLWFYYAGHGAAHPVTRERLILGDDLRADPTSMQRRGLPLDTLISRARGRASLVISVLDSCFTGTGRDGVALVEGGRFLIPTSMIPRDDVIEWSAAGPGEIALPLSSKGHGAFTYLVLGALRGWADGELDGQRTGEVTLQEASVFVRRSLRQLGMEGMSAPLSAPDPLLDHVLSLGATESAPSF